MNKLLKFFATLLPFVLPAIAFAQPQNNTGVATGGGTNAMAILGVISSIMAVIIPILITLAVIYVIVGVIKYATAKEEKTQDEARKTIISGVIALFVIVSIWGLVAIINNTFGVGQSGSNVGVCQPVWDPVNQQFIPPPQCS